MERDTEPDGGVAKEDIFGTGESSERARTPPAERFRLLFDTYVRAPFLIGWADWRTRIGGIGLLFYLLMGTVGVWLTSEPYIDQAPNYQQPFEDLAIPFGADHVGQSIFHMVIHSTPAMLQMALAGVVFSVGVATVVGFIAGYKGGLLDRALMTLTDTIVILPGLPLIMILAAIFTPRNEFLVGAIIAIDTWPSLARELRSQVLMLRHEDYVEASRSIGLGTGTIIGQDLMPKLAPYILINAAGAATSVIMASVALYFLGILPYNNLNWGVMMDFAYTQGNAVHNISHAGHLMLFPLLALSGLTFALTLFSQGLDRVFNPRLRARHAKTVPNESNEDNE